MKTLLLSMIAVGFALALGIAEAAKHEMPASDAVAAACKGKKAGDEVTVDGKQVKCPAAKAEEKKKSGY